MIKNLENLGRCQRCDYFIEAGRSLAEEYDGEVNWNYCEYYMDWCTFVGHNCNAPKEGRRIS